jgi:hypothetical protein
VTRILRDGAAAAGSADPAAAVLDLASVTIVRLAGSIEITGNRRLYPAGLAGVSPPQTLGFCDKVWPGRRLHRAPRQRYGQPP